MGLRSARWPAQAVSVGSQGYRAGPARPPSSEPPARNPTLKSPPRTGGARRQALSTNTRRADDPLNTISSALPFRYLSCRYSFPVCAGASGWSFRDEQPQLWATDAITTRRPPGCAPSALAACRRVLLSSPTPAPSAAHPPLSRTLLTVPKRLSIPTAPIVRSSLLTPQRPRSATGTLSPSPPPTTLTASGSTRTGTGGGGSSHLSTAETSLFSASSDDGEEPYASRSGFGWQADKSIPGLEGWDGGGGGGGGNSFADDLLVIDELPEGDPTEPPTEAESEAEPTPRYASTSTSWPARAAREGSATLPSFGGASRAGLLVDITPPPSADSFRSATPPGVSGRPAANGSSTSRSLAGAQGLQHLLGEVEDRTLLRLQHEPTFVSSSTSYNNTANASGGARARIPSGGGVDSVRRLREAFARAQDSPRTSSTSDRASTSPNTTRQPPAQPVWNPYTSPSGPSGGEGGASTSRSKAAVQSWLSTSQTSLPSPHHQSPPQPASAPIERRTIVPHPNELRSARGFPPPEPRQRTVSRSPEPSGSATDGQEPLGTDEDSPPTPPMRVPPTFSSRHGHKDASDFSSAHHRSAAFEEEATPPVRLPAGFGLYDESSLLGSIGRHMPDRSAATGATFEEEPTPAPSYARHRSRTPPSSNSPAITATARTAREQPTQAGSSLQTFMAFQQAPAQPTPRSLPSQLQPQPTPARPLASRASLSPAVAAHSTPPPAQTHDALRSRTRTSSTAKGKARARVVDTPSPNAGGAQADGSSLYATPGRQGEEDESLAFRPSRQLRRSPSKSFATPGPLPSAEYAPSPTPAQTTATYRSKTSPRTSPLVPHPLARATTPPVSPPVHVSPRRTQPNPPSPRRSSERKGTSFVLPSSTSPSASTYVSPLRAIVGSPSRERFSPRRMSTPPPATPFFIADSVDQDEKYPRGQGQSEGHDAGSERSDASDPDKQEPSVFASEEEPIQSRRGIMAEPETTTEDGDGIFDSIPLSPAATVSTPSRSESASQRQETLSSPVRPAVTQTPARRSAAAYGTLAAPGTVGAPTPRAPGGWGWTPGGAEKGKGRASSAPDTEDEVVVLRRRKVESTPLATPAAKLPYVALSTSISHSFD